MPEIQLYELSYYSLGKARPTKKELMPNTPKIEATAVALAELLADSSLPLKLSATKIPISDAKQNAPNEKRKIFFLFISTPIIMVNVL